ncbi:MAG TPA: rRNA maturation RNase YbeY [Myxococcales bacterium]|nr:rRNA maturation RNase YbeY [Myxococcales bacterium]
MQVVLRTPGARHAGAVLRAAAVAWAGGAELSIAVVSDRQMRALNRRWRGKDAPTDVLSFPLEERGALGDVAISLDTARRQAREGGWPLSVELRRLLAHGILHCRGYDHGTPREALRMARAERRLLGTEGMVGDSIPRMRVPSGRDSR